MPTPPIPHGSLGCVHAQRIRVPTDGWTRMAWMGRGRSQERAGGPAEPRAGRAPEPPGTDQYSSLVPSWVVVGRILLDFREGFIPRAPHRLRGLNPSRFPGRIRPSSRAPPSRAESLSICGPDRPPFPPGRIESRILPAPEPHLPSHFHCRSRSGPHTLSRTGGPLLCADARPAGLRGTFRRHRCWQPRVNRPWEYVGCGVRGARERHGGQAGGTPDDIDHRDRPRSLRILPTPPAAAPGSPPPAAPRSRSG